jgi:hypothetical protein
MLEKLWNWAKVLQLKPEDIRNEVLLSKNNFGKTTCHLAVERVQTETLEKLWN